MVMISAKGDEIIFPPLVADHENKAFGVLELPVNRRVTLLQVNVPGALITTFNGFRKFPGHQYYPSMYIINSCGI